ncbi:LAMI_0A04368g1_1 [Lachancea mirantina]|uniref:Protein EFR3 n=1 Tax=Lachancea mirantina TaxID=1230905 RepID=A0A1G4IPF0_9SACH|nr:LAMI_0A04368g1_1 [Lachancea mirantina]
MGLIFTPKHQKLVNQCYPTGRTPDKKPKSSETSYLLYYVNSRRTKLEKVSTYLVKKSTADLNHRRIGNITVTMELMNKIVCHCRENLNVFVKDFLHIMIKTLSNNNVNNDIGVLERIEETLSSICRNLDGALCNGDAEFIDLFKTFFNSYLPTVTERVHDSNLVLKGCTDISVVSNLAMNPQGSELLSEAAELALKSFQDRNPTYKIRSLDNTEQVINRRLTRTQTHALGLDDLPEDTDWAVRALQAFFNTSETDKLSLAIRVLLKILLKTPNKELLEFICNGIPVHLRYTVILIFIRNLSDENGDAVTILKLVSSLLVSEVSIIGLSVLDVMRVLLNMQSANGSSREICHQCSLTIADLNKKTYYKDQTSDMFLEVLSRLKDDKTKENRAIFEEDLQRLLESTTNATLSLDLFFDLTPFTDSYMKLFQLVSNSVSGAFTISKLFSLIDSMSSVNAQQHLMSEAFAKFKSITLLSGLRHYLFTAATPSSAYYIYHAEAARFLGLEDYNSQTSHKKAISELFSRDDLLNFYSDMGTNKYSEKGKRILLSKEPMLSTTDLISNASPEQQQQQQHAANPNDVPGIDNQLTYPEVTPTKPYDARSLKTLRYTTPKVRDLKNLNGNSAGNPSVNNLLRASQSVKSHITNITFLLSELDSDANELKIQDPDEEEIALERSEIARSQTVRLSTIEGKGSKRLSVPIKVTPETDEFTDAQEEVEAPSTRGKLFKV